MKRTTLVLMMVMALSIAWYGCSSTDDPADPVDGDTTEQDTADGDDVTEEDVVTEQDVVSDTDKTEVEPDGDAPDTVDEDTADTPVEAEEDVVDPCADCDPATQVCYGGVCRDLEADCVGDDMCLPCQSCTDYTCTGTPCLEDGDVDPDPDPDQFELELPDYELENFGFRFDTLTWIEPEIAFEVSGNPFDLTDMANTQFVQMIGDNSLNMLYAPLSQNLTSYTYDAVLGQAEYDAGTYVVNQQLQAFEIDQKEGADEYNFVSEPTDIVIPLPIQGNQLIISLRETTVRGVYNSELNTITNGIMAGALSREEAQALMIPYINQSLDAIIQASKLAGNTVHETTLSDGSAAWAFIMTYTAARVDIVQ